MIAGSFKTALSQRQDGSKVQYILVALLSIVNLAACLIVSGDIRFLFTSLLSILVILILIPAKRINFQPIQAWCLGFIIMIAPEGFFDGRTIAALFGENSYNVISLYICLAFTGVCFTAVLLSILPGADTDKTSSYIKKPTKLTYLILGAMYLSYFAYASPLAYTTFTLGRAETLALETSRTFVEALLAGVGSIAGITLPAAMTYFLLSQERKPELIPYLCVVALLLFIVGLQFLIGVRSVILATVISILFVYFSFYRLKLKHFPLLSVSAFLFFIATELMKGSRLGGSQALSSSQVSLSVENFYEGTVRYLTHMDSYFEVMGYRNGLEHLTLLLFWVPRAVWPGKPPQLENWFHRVVEPGGYPSFHSIAATFAATGYADFGFSGGLLIVIALQGLLLGTLQRKTQSYVLSNTGRVGHEVILYASSLGVIFYSVRQFNSVPISAITILTAYYIIHLTMKKVQR